MMDNACQRKKCVRRMVLLAGWVLAIIGGALSCSSVRTPVEREGVGAGGITPPAARLVQELKAGKNEPVNRQLIIDYLGSPGWIIPRDTAMSLSDLGPDAAFAVPALIGVINGEKRWSRHYKKAQKEAMKAIGSIGEKAASAVPSLIRMLDHIDPGLRKEAIVALGQIGVPARDSAGRLKEICQTDSAALLRREAVVALGRMKEPFLAFMNAFTDASPDVRESAVAYSVACESASPPLVSLLSVALSDQSASVRKAACVSLEKIGALARSASPRLRVTLDDGDYDVRKAAMEALMVIDPGAVPDLRVRLLANRLNDPERKERRQAIFTLAGGSINPAQAAPVIVRALKDRSRSVRLEAAKALGKLGVRSDEVVQALTESLRTDVSFQVRSEAAASLGLLGASGQTLETGLKDTVPFVRLKVLKALVNSDAPFFRGSFSWEAGSPDVAGYLVCYGMEAGKYPYCADMGTRTEFRVDDLKLPKDKTYYFVVRAYNKAGKSLVSEELVMSQAHVAEIIEKVMTGEADERVKKEAEKALKKIILQGGP